MSTILTSSVLKSTVGVKKLSGWIEVRGDIVHCQFLNILAFRAIDLTIASKSEKADEFFVRATMNPDNLSVRPSRSSSTFGFSVKTDKLAYTKIFSEKGGPGSLF